jgi:hypothetical protein
MFGQKQTDDAVGLAGPQMLHFWKTRVSVTSTSVKSVMSAVTAPIL